MAKHQSIPLRRIEESFIPCAADAFATTSVAGVGGWWAPTAESARQDQVFWFSISLGTWNLPEWLIGEKLQSYIASFEALGQLLLLLGRVRGIKSPAHHVLLMRQLCDNRGRIDAEDAIIEGTSCFCVTGHQLSCSGTRCAAHLCTLRGRAQWLGG